jgi:hypothetical protein
LVGGAGRRESYRDATGSDRCAIAKIIKLERDGIPRCIVCDGESLSGRNASDSRYRGSTSYV